MQQRISTYLSKPEIPLALFYFFYFALVGVYVIFMPKILLDFDYSSAEVGIIYAAAPFMRFLVPFVFRRYVALDYKVFLLSLYLTLGATCLFVGVVENFWLYLIANLLFGAAIGIPLPYVEAIALKKLSKSRYGKVRLYGSIGFAAIALWLGKVLTHPYEGLYYLIATALLTLLAGGLIARFDSDSEGETLEGNRTFSLLLYPWFWLSILLMQMSFGGFYNFFTIYETDHEISLETTSWLWSFGVFCEIIMLYFQGPLLQKDLLSVLKITTLIAVIRWLILYAYPQILILTFVAQALHAFTFALYYTAAISYVFTLYTQKKLAQQFLLGIAFGLGGSIGALIAGQVYGKHLFLIEAIIALFALFALFAHTQRAGKLTQGVSHNAKK